jgi:hypothetical protein
VPLPIPDERGLPFEAEAEEEEPSTEEDHESQVKDPETASLPRVESRPQEKAQESKGNPEEGTTLREYSETGDDAEGNPSSLLPPLPGAEEEGKEKESEGEEEDIVVDAGREEEESRKGRKGANEEKLFHPLGSLGEEQSSNPHSEEKGKNGGEDRENLEILEEEGG